MSGASPLILEEHPTVKRKGPTARSGPRARVYSGSVPDSGSEGIANLVALAGERSVCALTV